MSVLILKKGGDIFESNLIYNEEQKKELYEEFFIENDYSLISLLYHSVVLEKGYSLRDYFKMVDKYYVLRMMDEDFDEYIYYALNVCPKIGCCNDDFNELCFVKICAIVEEGKNKTLETGHEFIGVNKDNNNNIDLLSVAIEKMLDVPLNISNALYEEWDEEDENTYSQEKLSSKNVNLFELVKGVINELAASGSPEERKYISSYMFQNNEDC